MSDETDQPAGKIIDAFGGIRPMAARLSVPVSTVQGWKQRDTIPAGRMAAVRAAAEAGEINLEIKRGSGDLAATASAVATSPEPAGEVPVERESLSKTPPEPGKPAAKDRAATPARGSGVAVLSLFVALGVGGWVWWSTLGPGANDGDNARFSALEGRVARLAETNSDRAPAVNPADQAALAALTRDVAALRSRLSDLPTPDLDSALVPLRTEIAGLRDALAAQAAGGTGAGGEATLDTGLRARLEVIEVEIQNAIQLGSTNMQAMGGGLLDFDTKLKAFAEAQAKSQTGFGTRIDALEAGRSTDEAGISRASTLALAAGQLRTALERGAPYVGPLEMVETVSADDIQLGAAVTTLRGMSETGVATGTALELSFAKLVPDLLAAGRAGSDGAGAAAGTDRDLVDRLTGRLNDIISVRRTGPDVRGDDVEARIARAEIYLADRDVAAALAEFDGLSGPAADTLAPWLVKARGHVDARYALNVIEAEAITRLRAEGGPR
jgi:hypothetical protein